MYREKAFFDAECFFAGFGCDAEIAFFKRSNERCVISEYRKLAGGPRAIRRADIALENDMIYGRDG